ncbi:unnamed protein product [Symbiodinium microadriaticum]|nr:unnamed protein product [Symbiodinium microadriaticum]
MPVSGTLNVQLLRLVRDRKKISAVRRRMRREALAKDRTAPSSAISPARFPESALDDQGNAEDEAAESESETEDPFATDFFRDEAGKRDQEMKQVYEKKTSKKTTKTAVEAHLFGAADGRYIFWIWIHDGGVGGWLLADSGRPSSSEDTELYEIRAANCFMRNLPWLPRQKQPRTVSPWNLPKNMLRFLTTSFSNSVLQARMSALLIDGIRLLLTPKLLSGPFIDLDQARERRRATLLLQRGATAGKG